MSAQIPSSGRPVPSTTGTIMGLSGKRDGSGGPLRVQARIEG